MGSSQTLEHPPKRAIWQWLGRSRISTDRILQPRRQCQDRNLLPRHSWKPPAFVKTKLQFRGPRSTSKALNLNLTNAKCLSLDQCPWQKVVFIFLVQGFRSWKRLFTDDKLPVLTRIVRSPDFSFCKISIAEQLSATAIPVLSPRAAVRNKGRLCHPVGISHCRETFLVVATGGGGVLLASSG